DARPPAADAGEPAGRHSDAERPPDQPGPADDEQSGPPDAAPAAIAGAELSDAARPAAGPAIRRRPARRSGPGRRRQPAGRPAGPAAPGPGFADAPVRQHDRRPAARHGPGRAIHAPGGAEPEQGPVRRRQRQSEPGALPAAAEHAGDAADAATPGR